MNNIKEDMEEFLTSYTCIEDREKLMKALTGGDKYAGVKLECLQCPHRFFAIQEFNKKEVTCPKCGTRLIVRSYKNGNVNISRPKE